MRAGPGGMEYAQRQEYRSEGVYAPAIDTGVDGEGQEGEGQEWESREERRSPAAVLGSKRIGLVVLPEQLVDGIQSEINGESIRDDYRNWACVAPKFASRTSMKISLPTAPSYTWLLDPLDPHFR